jgi:hypothetical protein
MVHWWDQYLARYSGAIGWAILALFLGAFGWAIWKWRRSAAHRTPQPAHS